MVTTEESGITRTHLEAISRACVFKNAFLLIRPSTADTARLIQQGYATKSMDIHDKSSDWGPHAGFVPCDPAFSKTLQGTPNGQIKLPPPHGKAHAVQLKLTEALTHPGEHFQSQLDPKGGAVNAAIRYVKSTRGGVGAAGKVFRLDKVEGEWAVSWLDDSRGHVPVPLYVWGYQINGRTKPVTGDYDLWMVAPHIDEWTLHSRNITVGNDHGESGATVYINQMLTVLNRYCGRTGNPVFNHGAEAQNYGFTQAIDRRLVMFTPGGGVRMIERDEIAGVLADMYRLGYLVYWNKRYGEADPHLMGAPLPTDTTLPSYPKLAGSVAEIKTFFGELMESLKVASTDLMQGPAGGMLQLWREHDFPPDVKEGSHEAALTRLKLQQTLQKAMVELGRPNPPAALQLWFKNVLGTLEPELTRLYGKKPLLTFSAIPGTRAYSSVLAPQGPSVKDLAKLFGKRDT